MQLEVVRLVNMPIGNIIRVVSKTIGIVSIVIIAMPMHVVLMLRYKATNRI